MTEAFQLERKRFMGSTVACSVAIDWNLFDAHTPNIVADGRNVKGNLTSLMRAVVAHETPNAESTAVVHGPRP